MSLRIGTGGAMRGDIVFDVGIALDDISTTPAEAGLSRSILVLMTRLDASEHASVTILQYATLAGEG